MAFSVLIIDPMHPTLMPMLQEMGLEPDYQPELKQEEVLARLPHYEGLIVRGKLKLDRSLLSQAKRLKFIGRAGSGVDIIDMEAAADYQIQVFNAPEGNRDAVAEYTLGALLSFLHNITKSNAEVKNYVWDREGNRGIELREKKIGVIGYGNIGQQVVRRLAGFDCQVLVYDKYKMGTFQTPTYAREAEMEEIFDQCDMMTFHVPLTNETRGMIDETYLNHFRKPIVLINTSRGEILRLDALRHALETKKVIGAALDVLENEKLAAFTPEQKDNFEFLRQANNVILTPHIAGWTHESYRRINEVLVEKIRLLFPELA
ncbi:MAG: phosphoglycerate dehydrogenase [Microscillaceae bacterium]|nr:phosphoglycerate dehydrogenase [Microscillaceae bacterium]